ncbi:Lipoprotein [Prescottella defluvii]|uniref:hypothetical protein n=1 Tax=Prescottella defluvii TaxID=1323361 RepID=UPI0004F3D28F|nr:hypothetical protein [Prescottella defluvii]
MLERRGRITATVAATAALAALIGGCSSTESPTPGQSAHTATSAPTTPSTPPATAGNPGTTGGAVAGVTAEQAAQLCSDIEPQLQSWRTYTPSIGKAGLNTVVVTWATANGMNLVELAGDRGRIDAITTAQCPQVRDGALYALELPTLAAGLIGF